MVAVVNSCSSSSSSTIASVFSLSCSFALRRRSVGIVLDQLWQRWCASASSRLALLSSVGLFELCAIEEAQLSRGRLRAVEAAQEQSR